MQTLAKDFMAIPLNTFCVGIDIKRIIIATFRTFGLSTFQFKGYNQKLLYLKNNLKYILPSYQTTEESKSAVFETDMLEYQNNSVLIEPLPLLVTIRNHIPM